MYSKKNSNTRCIVCMFASVRFMDCFRFFFCWNLTNTVLEILYCKFVIKWLFDDFNDKLMCLLNKLFCVNIIIIVTIETLECTNNASMLNWWSSMIIYVVQIFDRMNLFIDVFHFNSDHSDLPLVNDIRSTKNQNRFVISENVWVRLSVHCFILVAPANEWISNDSQNLSSNWQTWPKRKMRMKINTIDRRKKENFNLKTKPENALAIFFWQFFLFRCLFVCVLQFFGSFHLSILLYISM